MTQEEKDVLAWYNKTYCTNIAEKGWKNRVNWPYISEYQTLSESFIKKFKNFVYWDRISQFQTLSESFISAHKDRVDWDCISQFQILSESFISAHKNRVDWNRISECQTLSEPFIIAHKDLVNWSLISEYQTLSESFIAANKDRLDWLYISFKQTLSESFIIAHKNHVDWDCILFNQILSKRFFKKYVNRMGCTFDQIDRSTWLYASEKRKIEHIKKKAPEFKVKRDEGGRYILAYKATDPGGRSSFDNKIRYEVGKTYEARCDHDMKEENSYGLSAWTKKRAKDFIPDGELYRVKIYIRDIGAMVHGGKKIRCKKQTFVERVEA